MRRYKKYIAYMGASIMVLGGLCLFNSFELGADTPEVANVYNDASLEATIEFDDNFELGVNVADLVDETAVASVEFTDTVNILDVIKERNMYGADIATVLITQSEDITISEDELAFEQRVIAAEQAQMELEAKLEAENVSSPASGNSRSYTFPDESDDTYGTIKYGTFTPRLSTPSRSNKYYFSRENTYQATGYGMPNCTAYAWGRAYEILGHKPNLPNCDAGKWWAVNKQTKAYSYGSKPRLGAIAVWGNKGNHNKGHVAVVEKIDGDMITISESGWNSRRLFWTSTHSIHDTGFGYPNKDFLGFIYIIDATDVSDEAVDSVNTYDSSFNSPSVSSTLVAEDESQSSLIVEDAEESVVEPATELIESVDDTSVEVEEGDGAVVEDISAQVSVVEGEVSEVSEVSENVEENVESSGSSLTSNED